VAEPERYLGVDVGGTKIATATVTTGTLGLVTEHPTPLASPEALLDGLESSIREALERDGKPRGIGVGVPSQIDWATGEVQSSVNIPLHGIALRQELRDRLRLPVHVDNDANCAALGEASLVRDPPAQHLVMLTLGTGVGGGLVLNGQIYRGATGLGAELGHVVVSADGPSCPGNCPNRGCLEALCSGLALERDAREIADDRPDGRLGRVLREQGSVTGPYIVAAARDGDADAVELFRRLGRMLGVGLAGFVNTFEPEHVVLGGGLSRVSDLFLDEALREARSRALPAGLERVSFSLARGGADAGVLGAALLAGYEDRARRPARDT
jgi:glucokinase